MAYEVDADGLDDGSMRWVSFNKRDIPFSSYLHRSLSLKRVMSDWKTLIIRSCILINCM